MVIPVVLLNLFFVPAVALWIHNKRRGVEFISSLKLLLEYAIFSICNIPLTKVGIVLVRELLHWDIRMDSGYYTLLAIVSAAILPSLLDKVRETYADRAKLLQKGKKLLTRKSIKYKQKLLTELLLVALIVIAYVIRGPLEIYAGNTQDLEFRLFDFLPWLLVIGVVFVAAASLLLARLPDVPFCMVSILLLWFGMASWIQEMFLNKKLSEANGAPMDWDSLGTMPRNNFLIWMLILAAVVLLCVRFKSSWRPIAMTIAGGLCLVQVAAIFSVFITLPEKKSGIHNAMGRNLSAEKLMQLAAEDNLIILVFDSTGTSDISSMLEEYPEAGEIVKDFVYYDNVCSDYGHTFPSVTHFFTGNEFVFDTSSSEWLYDSWNSERCSRFFQILRDTGYERRFFTSANSWVYGGIDNLEGKADNIVQIKYKVDTVGLLHKLLKTSTYRFLPYLWKPSFEVLTLEFGGLVTSLDENASFSDNNLEYYRTLTTERLSVDPELKKLFSFTHLFGAHPPRQHDAELNFKENVSDAELMRGLFKLLQEYFDQMKALGVYDDATIIVMGDHGNQRAEGMSPPFFLKQPGEKHSQMEINSAPVRYQDFQATILELIGQNDGSFGTSFFDWNEGQKRSRTLYTLRYDSNWPPLSNGFWGSNVYYGYTYDTDNEELRAHIINGPDTIERANTWP